MKVKMICFDMDGTIANLYGIQGWKDHLNNENPLPYSNAKPMWNMKKLNRILFKLQAKGIEIRIVTWLSKDSTEQFKETTRKAKMEWLKKYHFPYDHFHGVQYGTTKADCVRKYLKENESAILIDDNDRVRLGWSLGETINPTTTNILKALKKI